MKNGYKYEDLTGKTFGIMNVLKEIKTNKKGRYWLCQCSICEFKRQMSTSNLSNGKFEKCICKRFKSNSYEEFENYYKIYFLDEDGFFLCDKDDFYPYCLNHKWSLDGRGYVCSIGDDSKIIRFHRVVMGVTDSKLEVDHINGNPLDNRKKNLRICKHIDNGKNLRLKSNNTSGTPGVSFYTRVGKWSAEIKVDYQKIHLGYFNTKEEAVQVRKDAELKYFGKYSSINSRDGIYDKLSLDEILEKENNEKEILSAQSANLY